MTNELNFVKQEPAKHSLTESNINSQYLLELRKAIKDISRFDHSVSVPSYGSVFRYDPSTPLGHMQKGIADVYGVPFAYPSTNGTTPLNSMALMTLASPGDSVLIQRDSHVSVLAPFIHTGLRPVYIRPEYSDELGIPLGITPENLESTLNKNPNVKIIFLTYPNYFGVASDIYKLADIAKKRNIPLIVDSAHASHWAFQRDFPLRAEIAGAKIVTYSNHKTCSCLGQGSVMLVTDEKLIPRLYEVINNGGFVSTSFSTVILTALCDGIFRLYQHGDEILSERRAMAEWSREKISEINGLKSFGVEHKQPGFVDFDPLRLTVDVSGIGYSGYELEDLLINDFKYYPEMGTIQVVLFLITQGIQWGDVRNLVKILESIAKSPKPKRRISQLPGPVLPQQILLPREAFYHKRRRTVKISDSIGLVSAETISAYPPGSAVIVQGEQIEQESVEFLQLVRSNGATLKGATDPEMTTISVLDMDC